MKNNFFTSAFLLLLYLSLNSYAQPTIKTVRGIEDSLGNTHLFYHMGGNPYLFNNVYHFDLYNETDSILFYASIYISKIDFEFWNSNPSSYILTSSSIHGISSGSISKYNGTIFGGEYYFFEQIDMSKQD